MKTLPIKLILLAALTALPGTASAGTLTFLGSFFDPSPRGMAFQASSGNLFIADGSDEIRIVTTAGAPVSSFTATHSDIFGLSFLPNGNLLLTENSTSLLIENTTAGALPGVSVLTPNPLDISATSNDAEGAVFVPATNSIFVVDDNNERIYEFSTAGLLLNSFDTNLIAPGFDEPTGITYDPTTGHLLVVDGSNGTSSMYVVTVAGALIESFNLLALTGFDDPESIALDPSTRLLYIGFNNNEAVGVFFYPVVPEPASVTLLGLGGVGLIGYVRRRRRPV